jgi:hypothetical protein
VTEDRREKREERREKREERREKREKREGEDRPERTTLIGLCPSRQFFTSSKGGGDHRSENEYTKTCQQGPGSASELVGLRPSRRII